RSVYPDRSQPNGLRIVATRRVSAEDGDAGREAVQEIPAADRPDLTGAEGPGHRHLAEQLRDHTGVVVRPAEEPRAAAVAGEHQRAGARDAGQEAAQVLVGGIRVAHL